MCEKHYCTHLPETLCSCAPVQSGDVAQIVFHMAENMEDIRWELDYKSLGDLSGHRLCASTGYRRAPVRRPIPC